MAQEPDVPFAQALLERAFSPETAAIHYAERVVKRPLNVHPTSPTPSARAVRRQLLHERKHKERRRSKNKPRPLTAAQKRKLCLHEIPKQQQKYAIYEPLHELWIAYMREVLGLNDHRGCVFVTPQGSGSLLASADMHGALLSVVRSRCVSRVGLEGIVVRDTKHTFEIITTKNVIKAVPKEHTIFRFEIPLPLKQNGDAPKPFVFDLFGEQFQSRAPDRANKKFRMHHQLDL